MSFLSLEIRNQLREKLILRESQRVKTSLTHKSFYYENPTEKLLGHNERLEFLGDAVLDLGLSDVLFRRFPDFSEGQLSKIRSSLVNEITLSRLGEELGIGEFLILGVGEEKTGGRFKPRILASSLEALIGAYFLDLGYEKSLNVIEDLFDYSFRSLDLAGPCHSDFDAKTELQERVQGLWRLSPRYHLDGSEGPDHEKVFFVSLYLGDKKWSEGKGKSKKQAEQEAAAQGLKILKISESSLTLQTFQNQGEREA